MTQVIQFSTGSRFKTYLHHHPVSV